MSPSKDFLQTQTTVYVINLNMHAQKNKTHARTRTESLKSTAKSNIQAGNGSSNKGFSFLLHLLLLGTLTPRDPVP